VLKDVFRYEIPAGETKALSSEAPAETWEPLPPPVEEEQAESATGINHTPDRDSVASSVLTQSGEDLTAAWEKIAQLNDELAVVVKERDEAINESVLLQQDLTLANEKLEGQEGASGLVEELQQAVRERDEAINENNVLREELLQAHESAGNQEAAALQADELSRVTEERDRVRGDYVELRGQFESLKQEQVRAKNELGQGRAELEQEIQSLRLLLAEREMELSAAQSGSSVNVEELESLKQELSKTKNEASVAQRGLALSQKALQEARESAASGSSVSLDNLKKENATLVQQSMLLQAQHDQVARELSAAKARLAGR
jgi:chromosome segregation ATPase